MDYRGDLLGQICEQDFVRALTETVLKGNKQYQGMLKS